MYKPAAVQLDGVHSMVLYDPKLNASLQVKKLPKVFFTPIHLEMPLLL